MASSKVPGSGNLYADGLDACLPYSLFYVYVCIYTYISFFGKAVRLFHLSFWVPWTIWSISHLLACAIQDKFDITIYKSPAI